MKKLLFILPLLVACKTTKKADCDAYGYIIESDEFDIHKINAKNNSKFVTTTNIKYQ